MAASKDEIPMVGTCQLGKAVKQKTPSFLMGFSFDDLAWRQGAISLPIKLFSTSNEKQDNKKPHHF